MRGRGVDRVPRTGAGSRLLHAGQWLLNGALLGMMLGGAVVGLLRRAWPEGVENWVRPRWLWGAVPVWAVGLLGCVLLAIAWAGDPVMLPCLQLYWRRRPDGRYFGRPVKVLAGVLCLFLCLGFIGLMTDGGLGALQLFALYSMVSFTAFILYLTAFYSEDRDPVTTTYLNLYGRFFGPVLIPLTWPLLVLLHFSRRARTEELSRAQLWALAAGGVQSRWAGMNFDQLRCTTGAMSEENLEQCWGVHDIGSLRQRTDWLLQEGHSAGFEELAEESEGTRDDLNPELLAFMSEVAGAAAGTSLAGWDLSRLINLVRWSFTLGYVDRDEAWRLVMTAAERLQRTFCSWQELGANFCTGYRFWAEGGPLPDEVAEAFAWMESAPQSPWRALPWELELSQQAVGSS